MKLTDEQRIMVEKNMNLVHYVINHKCNNIWKNDYDDIFQIGVLGLCKAVLHYKPETGYEFAAFAIRCIVNEIYMEFRKIKKTTSRQVLSMESTIYGCDGEDEIPLIDTISALEDVESEMGLPLLKEMLRTRFSKRDREILWMDFNGVRQQDIAEHFGVSQPYISRKIKALHDIIRKEHGPGRLMCAS